MVGTPPKNVYRLLIFQPETQDNFAKLFAFSQFLFLKMVVNYNAVELYTVVWSLSSLMEVLSMLTFVIVP